MLAKPSIYRKSLELFGVACLLVLVVSLVSARDAQEPRRRGAAETVRAQEAALQVDGAMDTQSLDETSPNPQAPAQATPGDPPSIPTLPAERVWRIRLRAFPDTVGKGAYQCPGCDGVFSSGDDMGSAGRPLQPLMVVVHEPGNDENLYWMGRMNRQIASQAEVYTEVLLTLPPPYEVRLVTVDPLGYTLCPNSPEVFFLDQEDFDAVGGSAYGGGRGISQDWFFWRCDTGR
jgi:hypothetical protein